MEKLQLHSLYFTDRQQIRLHGSTKKRTVQPETRIIFLEFGRDNKDIIGVYSDSLSNSEIGLMRSTYNSLINLPLPERIKFFQELPSKPIVFRINQTDVENLLEWEDSQRVINRPITIESSVPVKWD